MKYYFLCAIGPVQDFIATARRSRDLWYGSWMLSELSKSAAKKIADQPENLLIFPSPEKIEDLLPGTSLNSPNKIAAVIETAPGQLAVDVENTVQARLQALFADAIKDIRGDIDYELAKRQVGEMLEFYWASTQFAGDDQYESARSKAEALLSARKVTRNFSQFIGESVPKSALDGARESVIPESAYPGGKMSKEKKAEAIRRLFSFYRARQGERLSGIDLMKRLGGGSRQFASTPDMAALPFFKRIEDEQGASERQKLLAELQKNVPNHKDFGVTEGLIFENRLSDSEDAEQTSQAVAKLLKEFKHVPSPYYAILAADGDNMGAVIDSQKSIAEHQKLSQTLSRFAALAEEIIEKHKGCSVYTGGDDVLAYLPMHTVLACADELQREFAGLMGSYEGQKDGKPVKPTLSVGISINHHIESLSEALELARDAEKKAKQMEGKNGLAIILSKRSGSDRVVAGKFESFYPRLKALIAQAFKKEISAGTAYELQELQRTLPGAGMETGLADEAIRVIKRKREGGSDMKVSEDTIQKFNDWLTTDNIGVDVLSAEMIVAKMFAQYRWDKQEMHA